MSRAIVWIRDKNLGLRALNSSVRDNVLLVVDVVVLLFSRRLEFHTFAVVIIIIIILLVYPSKRKMIGQRRHADFFPRFFMSRARTRLTNK